MTRLIAFVLLVVGLTPKSATPAPVDRDAQGRARTIPTTSPPGLLPVIPCSVPFCDDPVQVHIPVGIGDTWSFCLMHGLPYLRDEEEVSQ